jgi:hypothetical protein
MTIPSDWDLQADVVGCFVLAHLDTSEGALRFILNDEGWFQDANGDRWLGSKLIQMSEIEFSIGGTAPGMEIGFSYTVDPDAEDLVAIVRQFGVDAIRERDATFYLQYLARHEEFYAPVFDPIVIATRKMMQLRYDFSGPQTRTVSVVIEGPMNLRSKPVNGRYTDADQRRRTGVDDPSFEFMPNNSFDEQSLFGL